MNRKLSFALSLLFSFLSTICIAQHKQYTMQEATLGLQSTLASANIAQLHWIPGTHLYTFYDTTSKKIMINDATNNNPKILVTQSDIKGSSTMPTLHWYDTYKAYYEVDNDIYLLEKKNIEGVNSKNNLTNATIWSCNKWATLPSDADNTEIDATHHQITYTIKNNLYLIDKANHTHTITNDTEPNIINGQAVHRNEFGIDKGTFISPKGNYIAFYRMDQTMVDDYPIIDWSVTPAVNHNIKYPMAGGTSHQVTLGVYNPTTKQSIFLNTGTPKDHYLTCVTWSPDERYIFIAILNRAQNHLWLNQYNAQNGQFIKTLFEETDDKYVEPQHSLAFLPSSNNQFLWWSQRDGYMQLFRYDINGTLLNKVTNGDWLVNDILGFNTKSKQVIIAANKESPLSKNIYAVNWENGNIKRLDNILGIHNAQVSTDGNYIIDNYKNYTTPRQIDIVSTNGKLHKTIFTAPNPLADYERPTIKEVSLQANDGTPLYGRLILPTHFDANKKYPVIVYLYNGPHVQLIQNNFPECGNLWYEYLAQHGYVVFTMDGRGSSNRGLKFEQATFRQLGTTEMNDQLQGVAYLKSLPYVDSNRMGVHGWSFGGFMTTSLMLRHPGIFKCAVAGGPVMDWSMYEVMYTERYMDTPQENPDGYKNSALFDKVQNLKGKLLVIHGTQDATVVWQHSIKFIKACVSNGVQVDYFVYPGYEHNVRGKDRTHLMQKITDYFDEYLK